MRQPNETLMNITLITIYNNFTANYPYDKIMIIIN
jgi:hypothetical protein